ncbi:MAG: DUF1552 domain-containing protein [Vicinamibacterales bacterium]
MIITKTHLRRRTFLRGMGAALALPLLDAMVPAATAQARTAAVAPSRFGVTYVPNGFVMSKWTPTTVGSDFDLPPVLAPLAPHRDRVLVLSNLTHQPAVSLPGEGSGDHVRAAATFLTGVHPKRTEGADIRAGVSLDQIVARHVGRDTPLDSLELCLESNDLAGSCEAGYSCAYANTLAWRTETTPLPMENDPRAVFERLFGDTDSTTVEARMTRLQRQRSLLDGVLEDVNRLRGRIGADDRLKLTQYLDAVRDTERRIQKIEAQADRELPPVERPVGTPAAYADHARLMFDLQVLAFQGDVTRVTTFMMARETSQRPYPEIGIADGHHGLSHHGGAVDKIEKVTKINVFHMTQFAYFLERLRATPDGDGSLLDHTVLLYGCGLSDSNQHLHNDLPILVAGGRGRLAGGRHVRLQADTPLTNLQLTVLDALGVPLERFGDSTGRVRELSA